MEADSSHEASCRWPAFPDLAGHFHRPCFVSFLEKETGSLISSLRRPTTPVSVNVIWYADQRVGSGSGSGSSFARSPPLGKLQLGDGGHWDTRAHAGSVARRVRREHAPDMGWSEQVAHLSNG
jgi:hypothetical protein